MEERTRHRAVGAVVLLVVAVIVLPLALESSPPDERPASEPAPADPSDASPDRIRITTIDGDEDEWLSPGPRGKAAGSQGRPGDAAGPGSGTVSPAAGWAVQIGSFGDPGNAEGLRKQVASRGYRVFTQRVTTREGKPRVRVLVGPDRTRAAAATRLRLLREEDSIQGFLVRFPG